MESYTMEKAKIGAVLKKRIKEKNYTQEQFAEEVGVKYSTLKKYLSGKTAYSYELLLEFAEKLDCSVEYLLGLSKSPNPEYHEITEQTRLSEKAIEKICKYAKEYDTELEAKSIIRTIDMLICEDGAISSIRDYLISYRLLDEMTSAFTNAVQSHINRNAVVMGMEIEDDKRLSLETQMMINVVMRLKDLKTKATPEFLEDIKQMDTEEKFVQGMEKLNALLGGYQLVKVIDNQTP